MPLAIQEFIAGLEPEDREILDWLEHQPYMAYTLAELPPNLKTGSILDDLLVALAKQPRVRRLVEKGLVREKTVGGRTYYASAKALG